MCEHAFYYKSNLEDVQSISDLEQSLEGAKKHLAVYSDYLARGERWVKRNSTSIYAKSQIESNEHYKTKIKELNTTINNHQVEINRRKLNALAFNPGPRLNLEEIREKLAA